MLRKLGSYPRQNGLAVALRELGRIERTPVHPGLAAKRRAAPPRACRAEQRRARNALARAVFFNRLGKSATAASSSSATRPAASTW